ncbi:MAG TPA: hypothetical protein VHB98_05825, partial [Chloroflexota bacterium]|nr:hypothetical protein [Chloroflexota bacterium]
MIEEQLEPAAPSPTAARAQDQKDSIVALVEAALLLDIVVVLCLIRTFVPIPGFQGVIRLICPAPFVLLGLRHGVRTTFVATVG